MKTGLYRITDPFLGECIRLRWEAGDAGPFLARDIYEALDYEPGFDQLPSKEAFLGTHSETLWRYGSPLQRLETAPANGEAVSHMGPGSS